MGGSTTDWSSVQTWERVVAATIASYPSKPNITQIAEFYGTTYDTIEGRFRKIKKMAEEMKSAADGDGNGTPAPKKSVSATPRKRKTPKKDPLETVANARVKKNKNPTKKPAVVKHESPTFENESDCIAGATEEDVHDTSDNEGFPGFSTI